MLRKHSRVEKSESADGERLVLQTVGVPCLYQFPADVVQTHRHMITRLMRDQRMVGRLSMVSALRGEGVTFSSLAMATTFSHDFSRRVCYVDLNWWWPAPQMAKLNQYSQGIAGMLRNDSQIEDVLVRTELSNFCLMPAGQLPPDQRPVVARGAALKQIITQLSEKFDTLVLDIPAILATSDSISLAAQGETCLVVIQQGATSTTSVKQALDDIANMPVIGVLLNRMNVATPTWLRNWIPEL